MNARARAALADAWQVLCLFVVEECQPPDWLRRLWLALMWGFVAVAVWLLVVILGAVLLLAATAVLADILGSYLGPGR